MKKYLVFVLLLACLYFGGRVLYHWDRPNSDSTARVPVEIKPGSSLKRIVQILEDKELIADPLVFRWFVTYQGLGNKLQAGEYILQKNLTFSELVEVLQNGRSAEIKITIPEGYTVDQIDSLLAKKGLTEVGAFNACVNQCDLGFRIPTLEGYLFPSTYFVAYEGFTSKRFIAQLYKTFQQKIAALKADINKNGRSLEAVVIVASMIEREAFGDSYEEKQKISGVIWKRLDEGIPLGIDATTRYEKNDWKGPLYAADFETDSPYNTRRKLGLPPTAISNPGLESLKAATYPVDTEFYYYLHDPTGQIHFGRTLEEHNQNKRDYLY